MLTKDPEVLSKGYEILLKILRLYQTFLQLAAIRFFCMNTIQLVLAGRKSVRSLEVLVILGFKQYYILPYS